MPESIWKIQDIRKQVAVIDGIEAPTIVLKNARYLHSIFKKWLTGNIWILENRIIYVGQKMPLNLTETEVIDLEGKTVVPGYMEPHVHPFQLYNPHSFADFAAQTGTTTFIADNMTFMLSLPNKKAFAIIDQLKSLPFSFYWWVRFDSQTELDNEDALFTNKAILEWIDRPDTVVGGELTGWPRLLNGDDQMLYWIQCAKLKSKKIEGHFPGASERTLAKMKLFGTNGDHESMTVEEVERRILHGYAVTLRYSSIRPDLPELLKGILEKDLNIFDHLMMTTDGSTPGFHKDGVMDKCIQVALDAGVDPIDAYNMASYNVARYYNMEQLHGLVATGRFATLNILKDEYNPNPEGVLSKGVWLKRANEKVQSLQPIDWAKFGKLNISFDLEEDDFQFSMPIGIEMVNDVITKPYRINVQLNQEELSTSHDHSYLILIDRKGKWRVNTMLKGFATHVKGLATSYSNTGHIILIGKSIKDMKKAFYEVKKMNGGIALVENEEVIASIPLTIGGSLYNGPIEELIEKETALKSALKERGYHHSDAIYTLLFLQSTHLPYIRITPRGIFDVMKKQVMLPAVMR
ncbi:adenine deaminase [Ureibacillus massiliensis 4400831 = CIP 108448 = CCUG 49529]|uniref:adenine deaminase n=1 Tax=Ureibacillus massiliensis 4400831 = CIP 108448 = CCUG 49529 TaxID=1211035 RepID=A0A0A3J1X2_9BACL|nr:adenine deaminase C-terminal domain-containing protein [Ureibacillus massiliensis]KGR91014.1 adenine deaminase [Ureibacillus massiliensis 4400831 = CIP 108448 = CCUG 49529]